MLRFFRIHPDPGSRNYQPAENQAQADYEGEVDLVFGQLFPNGGTPEFIQAVRDASDWRISKALRAINDPEARERLTNIMRADGADTWEATMSEPLRIDMLDTDYFRGISRGYDPQTGLPLGFPLEKSGP